MPYKYAIGIDVGKAHIDGVLHGSAAKPQRFAKSCEGFAGLRKAFAAQLPEAIVVLEATGGYETALLVEFLSYRAAVHRAGRPQASLVARPTPATAVISVSIAAPSEAAPMSSALSLWPPCAPDATIQF